VVGAIMARSFETARALKISEMAGDFATLAMKLNGLATAI